MIVNESMRVRRAAGREKAREEGQCRMCERPWSVRAEDRSRHHVVPQSYFNRRPKIRGLRDVDANIIPLCRPCHDLVENVRDDLGRRLLRRSLAQVEIAFAIAVRGQPWFDGRYPAVKREKRSKRLAVVSFVDPGLRRGSAHAEDVLRVAAR